MVFQQVEEFVEQMNSRIGNVQQAQPCLECFLHSLLGVEPEDA
jgi:hypothetical protein